MGSNSVGAPVGDALLEQARPDRILRDVAVVRKRTIADLAALPRRLYPTSEQIDDAA
jgi:hypothetical protein